MLCFRTLEEVHAAHLRPHIQKVVQNCVQTLIEAYGDEYDPDDCGYVVLYTETTTDENAISLFGRTWTNACLEGVLLDEAAKCFLTCVLCNNEFGYTIVVPDEPWLDPAFRAKLISELTNTP